MFRILFRTNVVQPHLLYRFVTDFIQKIHVIGCVDFRYHLFNLSQLLLILRKKIYHLYMNEWSIWPLAGCINKFVSISTVLTFERNCIRKWLYLVKSRILCYFTLRNSFYKGNYLSWFTITLSRKILLRCSYRVWTSLLVLVFKRKYQSYDKFIHFIEAHNFKSHRKLSNYL